MSIDVAVLYHGQIEWYDIPSAVLANLLAGHAVRPSTRAKVAAPLAHSQARVHLRAALEALEQLGAECSGPPQSPLELSKWDLKQLHIGHHVGRA